MKSVEVLLIIVYIYIGYISCGDVDFNKLLNRVLMNEKLMQDRIGGLEKQVVELQSEIRNLKKGALNNDGPLSGQNRAQRLLIDQTEQQTKVAFSAYMSSSLDASQISSGTQIRYDSTECNVYKAYDANTGAFRAPVRGTYVFAWTTCAGGDYGELGVELVVNGIVHGSLYVDSEERNDEECSSGMVIISINAGDTVYTRSQGPGSGHIRSDTWMRTTFSGWLLFQ